MLLWFLGLYWFQMHTHAEFFVLTKSSVYIHVFIGFFEWFYAIIMILTTKQNSWHTQQFFIFSIQIFFRKRFFLVCHEFQFFGKNQGYCKKPFNWRFMILSSIGFLHYKIEENISLLQRENVTPVAAFHWSLI